MQAWFSEVHPGVPPYRLYALSNAGSLLALVSYPFLVNRTSRAALRPMGGRWASAYSPCWQYGAA